MSMIGFAPTLRPRYRATRLKMPGVVSITFRSERGRPAASSRAAIALAATSVCRAESLVLISMSCLRISRSRIRGSAACAPRSPGRNRSTKISPAIRRMVARVLGKNFEGGLDGELGGDGVGDEALVVGLLVQSPKILFRKRARLQEDHVGSQRDALEVELAARVRAHAAIGSIPISVDAQTLLRGDGEEPEHMAAGQGGNERLLRIDGGRIRVRH